MPAESQEFTFGVEEEYQLVDAQGGELRSRARSVLAMDWTGDIKPEMQQNTVEVGTRVCRSVEELRRELERLRLEAAVAAESRGLRVVAAGTHPFTHWSRQTYTPGPTYQRIREEFRRLADSQNIFGMHVHVAVPPELDRAAIMNVVRHYSAHLLALSASSPFFVSEDTGYSSYRSILWRRWPRTGPPPRFSNEAEFQALLGEFLGTGCLDAPGRLYWEVRPHHGYPTLEFRSADVTPRLEDAVLVAVLARLVVRGAAEGLLREPDLPESRVHPFLVENGWRASRDGVGAHLVDFSTGRGRAVPVAESLLQLVEQLKPLAGADGELEVLDALPALLERGGAASRLRTHFEETHEDWSELVRWVADETTLGLGMDRRSEQRNV